MDFSSIDIFCRRIDNYGDVGVAYRFARELKAARPECRVRAFFSDIAALREIAGEIDPSEEVQERDSVICLKWWEASQPKRAKELGVADVMVEMFACDIPEIFMEMAYYDSKLIINLEYLSAEEWVEDYHLKESLLGRGSARKFFFLPGFRATTGGLIINSRLREAMEGGTLDRYAVLNRLLKPCGLRAGPEGGLLVGSVFTYERGFDTLLSDLVDLGRETVLLVFGDKSRRGMSASLARAGAGGGEAEACDERAGKPCMRVYKNIRVVYAPFMDQHDYDTLLCCTDFNIVRGEDSLARAALSGRPFIWNAYIQETKYQKVKVAALLREMRQYFDDEGAFAAWSELMTAFNDAPAESPEQATAERYADFFKNLKKHERAAERIYYFMHRNCDLVSKFCGFLDGYRPDSPATGVIDACTVV